MDRRVVQDKFEEWASEAGFELAKDSEGNYLDDAVDSAFLGFLEAYTRADRVISIFRSAQCKDACPAVHQAAGIMLDVLEGLTQMTPDRVVGTFGTLHSISRDYFRAEYPPGVDWIPLGPEYPKEDPDARYMSERVLTWPGPDNRQEIQAYWFEDYGGGRGFVKGPVTHWKRFGPDPKE